jgi:hypothetical protein
VTDRDDALLGELRSLLARTDAVPAEVTEFANAALGWRRLDAELAELLADSALEGGPALTRADGDARWLTFRTEEMTIDVQATTADGTHTLLGRIDPPLAATTVEVQGGDGETVASTTADDAGRFKLVLDRGGRIRLRVAGRGRPPVETSWLSL